MRSTTRRLATGTKPRTRGGQLASSCRRPSACRWAAKLPRQPLSGEHGDPPHAPGRPLRQQAPRGGRAVVAVGCVHVTGENTVLYTVNYQIFAAVNVLAAVGAPVLRSAGHQLDALAVHAHERGGGGPIGRWAVGPVQGLVEAGLYGRLPAAEVGVHRRPGRENGRQGAPLAARAVDVAHSIQDAPQTQAPVAVHGQRRPNLPLRVGEGLTAVNHFVAGALERLLQLTDSFLFSLLCYPKYPLSAPAASCGPCPPLLPAARRGAAAGLGSSTP